ncbi:MAG: Multifunctional cyclase-dehydratase-3-O-methyl transferase TcmN, partial [Chlamydiae bacterium]|nr:Multifunctional cyclase-dehydratase-3-O-methyl transferase TcmN [Chlamydiota bacterium]
MVHMRYLFLFLTSISLLFSSEREELLNIVSGQWIAQGVYTAAKMDVAGHLLNGTKSIEQLAELTSSDEDNLYRLLRMLASVGIFTEKPGRNFSNTNTSAILAEKHPQSLRSLILFYSCEMSRSFDKLDQCVQRGTPAFELTFQKPVFEYFRDNPSSAKLFNEAMKEKSQLVVASCLEAYNFGKFSTVYDIGGGIGLFLTELLQKYPRMRGLLFELPEVISEAKPHLKNFGQRCGMIAGDFFKNIPPDGDAYLLKSVIHDWDDDNAVKILRKCHSTMQRNAKLLIVEPLIAPA